MPHLIKSRSVSVCMCVKEAGDNQNLFIRFLRASLNFWCFFRYNMTFWLVHVLEPIQTVARCVCVCALKTTLTQTTTLVGCRDELFIWKYKNLHGKRFNRKHLNNMIIAIIWRFFENHAIWRYPLTTLNGLSKFHAATFVNKFESEWGEWEGEKFTIIENK